MRVTALIDALLSPLTAALLLALLLWCRRSRLPRGLRRAAQVFAVMCFVSATPFGADALVALQQRRVATPAACAAPAPDMIVLLAGGTQRAARDAEDVGALNSASVQRTVEAAGLVLATPGAQLVLSGGVAPGERIAESVLMASLARRLGVPAAAIRTEALSRTTWENAQRVRALQPSLPARIWLVTSAVHMPRALVAFRAAGFEPCARATDFHAPSSRALADALPRGSAVAATEALLHEWVGELAYRWRARR